jgi:geranylgeranyl diphosphate synthase type II
MPQKRLLDAMRYSLFTGGKRLRPVMLLEFCRMCGGAWEPALPYACALEMIHTYSLIHDDLPCMDNDDARRGKLTNHIVYGEATALLAGSALLSAAFETMLRPPAGISPERALQAAYIIARSSGLHGLAGGQELDLHHDGKVMDTTVHERKTAAVFIAAAEAGCVIAGARPELREEAARFAHSFGLGFQFADDFTDGETSDCDKALGYYREALTRLNGFEDTAFITELTGRLTEKLRK